MFHSPRNFVDSLLSISQVDLKLVSILPLLGFSTRVIYIYTVYVPN